MHNLLASLLLLPAVLQPVLGFAALPRGSTKRSTACNNSPDLCDRRYNNVTYLGAHDSPFLRDASTDDSESGDQFYNSTVQLSAGVRLLTAQVHELNSTWHLCHTSCDLLDAGLLSDWLIEIKDWLVDNPDEVVTILLVNSDDATASDLKAQYEAAGIESLYTPTSTTAPPSEWPTLQTLINNGTRLLNFVASLDPADNTVAPYLMDEFTFIFENNYDNSSPSNFSCTANRPSSVNGDTTAALNQKLMPLMNHFLYTLEILDIEVPDVSYANITNAPSGGGTGNLGDAAIECRAAYGKAPTYLLVDFFNVGPAIETADSMNNITNAVGRLDVSEAESSDNGTTTTSSAAHISRGPSGALALALVAMMVVVA